MAILPKSITVDSLGPLKNSTVIVNFNNLNRLRVRLWIGGKLIRLAAFVMGCGIEFKTGDK